MVLTTTHRPAHVLGHPPLLEAAAGTQQIAEGELRSTSRSSAATWSAPSWADSSGTWRRGAAIEAWVAEHPERARLEVAVAARLLLGHGHGDRVAVEVLDAEVNVVEQQRGEVAAHPLAHHTRWIEMSDTEPVRG